MSCMQVGRCERTVRNKWGYIDNIVMDEYTGIRILSNKALAAAAAKRERQNETEWHHC